MLAAAAVGNVAEVESEVEVEVEADFPLGLTRFLKSVFINKSIRTKLVSNNL